MAIEVLEKDSRPVDVSVVLPAYNEEENIAREIDTIRLAMGSTDYAYEILIIDDASTDRTREFALEKGTRVISHQRNEGVGKARNSGILQARGKLIVASDADGTYPHDQIPQMLSYFPGADMVIGARTGVLVEESWHHTMPKYFIRKMAIYLSGIDIPDLNTGLRAFKKDKARLYFSLFPNGHSWESTITLAFLCNGHAVVFHPINYFKRKGGRSTFTPFRDTYRFIVLTVRTIMYFNPIGVLLPAGLAVFAAGFIKTVYDFIRYHNIGGADVFILVTSVNLITLAFIADLLVMLHRKNQP